MTLHKKISFVIIATLFIQAPLQALDWPKVNWWCVGAAIAAVAISAFSYTAYAKRPSKPANNLPERTPVQLPSSEPIAAPQPAPANEPREDNDRKEEEEEDLKSHAAAENFDPNREEDVEQEDSPFKNLTEIVQRGDNTPFPPSIKLPVLAFALARDDASAVNDLLDKGANPRIPLNFEQKKVLGHWMLRCLDDVEPDSEEAAQEQEKEEKEAAADAQKNMVDDRDDKTNANLNNENGSAETQSTSELQNDDNDDEHNSKVTEFIAMHETLAPRSGLLMWLPARTVVSSKKAHACAVALMKHATADDMYAYEKMYKRYQHDSHDVTVYHDSDESRLIQETFNEGRRAYVARQNNNLNERDTELADIVLENDPDCVSGPLRIFFTGKAQRPGPSTNRNLMLDVEQYRSPLKGTTAMVKEIVKDESLSPIKLPVLAFALANGNQAMVRTLLTNGANAYIDLDKNQKYALLGHIASTDKSVSNSQNKNGQDSDEDEDPLECFEKGDLRHPFIWFTLGLQQTHGNAEKYRDCTLAMMQDKKAAPHMQEWENASAFFDKDGSTQYLSETAATGLKGHQKSFTATPF